MPAPTTRQANMREAVQGSNSGTPTLSVGAQIQVQGGGRSNADGIAQSLIDTLGLGARVIGGQQAEQAAALGAKQKAQDAADFTQGNSDALSGSAKAGGTQAYLNGVSKITAGAQLAADTAELSQGAQPFIDSHDLTGLQGYLQDEHAKRWNGAGEYSAKMANDHYAELAGTLTKQLRDQAKIDTTVQDEANLGIIANESYAQSLVQNKPFDFYGTVNDGTLTIHKGTGEDANAVGFRILQSLMAKYHDPSIIDNMPDLLSNGAATLKTNLKYSKSVIAMRDEAVKYQGDQKSKALVAEESHVMNSFSDRIAAGSYPSVAEIDKSGDTYGWTAEQRHSWHAKIDAAIKAASDSQDTQVGNEGLFAQGRGQEVASDPGFRKSFDEYVGTTADKITDPHEKLMFVLRSSAANGAAYRPLANTLTNPNMADPQALLKAAATVREIGKSPYAGAVAQYVTSEKAQLLYTTINTLQDLGYKPTEVLAAASKVSAPDRAERWASSDIRKEAIKDIGDKGTVFERAEALRITEALGASGNFESSDALKKARESAIKDRYFKADGNTYMRNADTPANAEDVVAWFRKEKLPGILEAHPGVKPEDVQLVPDSRSLSDRNSYVVQYKNSIITVDDPTTNEPARFNLSGPSSIASEYNVFTQNAPIKAARSKWTDVANTTPLKRILPSVDSYLTDRSALAPTTRAKLDSLYVKKAGERVGEMQALQQQHEQSIKTGGILPTDSNYLKNKAEAASMQKFYNQIKR
jgi:hypothetical protein